MPLRPHAYRLADLDHDGTDYLESRTAFLRNGDVVLHKARLDAPMPYHFRNADADEIIFVHQGTGRIETDFGPLDIFRGHYVVIPRGTVYRLIPEEPFDLLIVESRGEVQIPDRGLMGRHALFDPNVIDVPTPAEPTHWVYLWCCVLNSIDPIFIHVRYK